MKAAYTEFQNQLTSFISEDRLITDPLRTLAYGTDASFYRMIPKLIVRVESEAEVSRILQLAREMNISVTFRAAGTSLSGQSVTDSVLIVLGKNWSDYKISTDAKFISLQPGVIGAQANRYLMPFNRKIGPDPASINAAKIGGIAANNSSGMCCGTSQNSYRTLQSMRIILADGTCVDTGNEQSVSQFKQSHRHLLDTLDALGRKTRANSALAERIAHKYRLKNTTGYAINALVDYEDPLQILQHLMIGSEGTLGFISEITYQTVTEHKHKASALAFYSDVDTACQAVAALKSTPVAAVELMDGAGLKSIQDKPGMPAVIRSLPNEAAALLIETRANSADEINQQISAITAAVEQFNTVEPVQFTEDPEVCARYWAIRKGLFPAVGAVRDTGTTVIIEDIAVAVSRLAEAVKDLQVLFDKWGYHEAIIFGHALDGNLHFVFTQAFDTEAAVTAYSGLMDDVAQLISGKYDGSLKAEHGTGRNMAPFVELEWGKEGYSLMQEIKQLLDPDGILNPGVILNDNPNAHLENLKPLPAASDIVDRCIECGFCEPTCPSRALTLTPRQRIVMWREIARLRASGESPERLKRLEDEYGYFGDETCAACGLCSTACPVGINTGDLTRSIRHEKNKHLESRGEWIADHFSGISSAAKATLTLANVTHSIIGTSAMTSMTQGIRKLSGNRVQQWLPTMPKASAKLEQPEMSSDANRAKVVYLPSCASRVMGPQKGAEDNRSLHQVTISLLKKAGFDVIVPDNIDGLCCGMPFQSKGLFETADKMSQQVSDTLLRITDSGAIPVYSDTSPCSLRLKDKLSDKIAFHDSISFIDKFVLPKLNVTQSNEPVALHITCSTTRMGLADSIRRIANSCSSQVVVPEGITCCGFAGDKGFTTPELNASSLASLKDQVSDCTHGYSSSRTCEIGLSQHSGIEYRSIVYLLDRCSSPLNA